MKLVETLKTLSPIINKQKNYKKRQT